MAAGAAPGRDLSSYSGATVRMESGQMVTFVVKDNAGGYFGSSAIGGGTGTQSYTLTFSGLTMLANSQTSELDLTQVLAFEFDAVTPTSYGFAIHSVTLE
ncbi:MAG: hypothetical protein ACLP1X_32150 [Polyangiaceae bacterium]